MGADVEYSVAAILQLSGDADAERKLARVAKQADKTSERLKQISIGGAEGLARLGSFVGDTIDHMARLGAAGAIAGAALGGAFAYNEIKTGLVDVNAHLENANIGFATLFHTLGNRTMGEGFREATDLIGQIREDAKNLPGEFGDFVGMAQTVTAPMLNMGKGIKDVRDLTRDTVVAASALGIRYDQASREMAMLLEGHAGAHNILGLRLGITTHTKVAGKDFNEASMSERFEYLTKKLGPAKDALGAFAGSWEGLTSTLSDSRKQFLGAATEPLFGRMKSGMVDLLHYLDTNKAGIDHLAMSIGVDLANAYGRVELQVRRMPDTLHHLHDRWSAIRGQVDGVAHTITAGVNAAIHAATPLARALGHELEHPSRLLKEIIALRVAAGIAKGAPGLLSFGLNASKFLGAGEAAAGAVGAGEGAALAGVGAGAAAAGPVLIAAGVALAAIAAVGVAVWDDAYGSASKAKIVASEFDDTLGILGGTLSALGQKGGLLRDTLDILGATILTVSEKYLGGLNIALGAARDTISWLNNDLEKFIKVGFGYSDEARVKVDVMATAIEGLAASIAICIPGLREMMLLYYAFGGGKFEGVPDQPLDYATDAPMTSKILGSSSASVGPEKPKVSPAPIVDARGSKFEVKIDARDQDPDRVIRRLFDRIGQVAIDGTMGPAARGLPGVR